MRISKVRKLGKIAHEFHDLNVFPYNNYILENGSVVHNTGFSFSRLRPQGDTVASTGGVASGPISFMKAFDASTDVIKQGGFRRGANMGILDAWHPDIEAFIDCKLEKGVLTNFNLSIGASDEFMECVETNSDFALRNPNTKETVRMINANVLFDKACHNAWKRGDPGIIFLDEINDGNPTPHLGRIESTNPCGEQILLPYESCNLGSINLSKMLIYNSAIKSYEIDYEKLEKTVHNAVRFLDDVIDVNKYPIPEIERVTKSTRKIGLGVMGFADALIMMEISYDSDEAMTIARGFMENIRNYSFAASENLATEKGNFPAFEGSIHERNGLMRNASRTTIAPTGTLSLIANCSSGIEPIFDVQIIRKQADTEYIDDHRLYAKAKKEGWTQERIDSVFRIAKNIDWEWHLRMQAVFQRYTENAVSKTIILPFDSTVDDVRQAYLEAYHKNLKGITIYRDGSREDQILSSTSAEIKRKERPGRLEGYTEKILTGCGTAFITINHSEEEPYEVFITMAKGGSCAASHLEAVGRMVSLALRNDIDIPQIIKQLRGIRCPEQHRDFVSGTKTLSCSDAISVVLNKLGEARGMEKTPAVSKGNYERCPECGDFLYPEEGCAKCYSCGHARC